MNRLQQHSLPSQACDPETHEVSQAKISSSTTPHLNHTLFVPLHYEPNYAYPLVVWLHGPGDDERQLLRVMPLVSMRNYVAVGPRGTSAMEEDKAGYRWEQSEHGIADAEHFVFQAIEAALVSAARKQYAAPSSEPK